MEYRNAIHNHFGGVDMEINHPQYGWIPFTASPEDIEPLSKELYELTKDIAQEAGPAPEVVLPELTPRQLWLAALTVGITKESVLEVVENTVTDLEEKEYIKIELNEANLYGRNHPAVEKLVQMMGMPKEQVDVLWVWASSL